MVKNGYRMMDDAIKAGRNMKRPDKLIILNMMVNGFDCLVESGDHVELGNYLTLNPELFTVLAIRAGHDPLALIERTVMGQIGEAINLMDHDRFPVNGERSRTNEISSRLNFLSNALGALDQMPFGSRYTNLSETQAKEYEARKAALIRTLDYHAVSLARGEINIDMQRHAGTALASRYAQNIAFENMFSAGQYLHERGMVTEYLYDQYFPTKEEAAADPSKVDSTAREILKNRFFFHLTEMFAPTGVEDVAPPVKAVKTAEKLADKAPETVSAAANLFNFAVELGLVQGNAAVENVLASVGGGKGKRKKADRGASSASNNDGNGSGTAASGGGGNNNRNRGGQGASTGGGGGRGGSGGGSGGGKGLSGKNWSFDSRVDVDFRGTGKTYRDALEEAFNRTGVSRDQFEVTEWGKTPDGKSIPVEYTAKKGPYRGAQVSIDIPKLGQNGPSQPHIGYQSSGKSSSGGRLRGHIFVDDVPATRP